MTSTEQAKPELVQATERVLAELSNELSAYCHLQGLEPQCAHELLHDARSITQHEWFSAFIDRWDAAEEANSLARSMTGWRGQE